MLDPAERSRFVVLHHVPGDRFDRTADEHYDWMFHVGDDLRTWASPVCGGDLCNLDQPLTMACQALPPHRVAYLDYEGPVSGNRGTVRRVLAGTFQVQEGCNDGFSATLAIDGDGCQSLTVAFQRNWVRVAPSR